MLFLILLPEAPTLAQTSSPAHPQVTAFVHVNVVPTDRGRIVPNQTVLVEDGKIRSVGTTLSLPADALIIACKTVLPAERAKLVLTQTPEPVAEGGCLPNSTIPCLHCVFYDFEAGYAPRIRHIRACATPNMQ
jgi:hypothetical protein